MNATTATQCENSGDIIRIHNKNLIFAALAEAGIHRVTVEYDGSDDSGQIESIEAWNAANEKIPLPTIRKVQLASENPDSSVNEIGLEAAVEQLVWDYLYDNHGGWENNDGGYGEFIIDVAGRTICLEFCQRYSDYTKYNHNF